MKLTNKVRCSSKHGGGKRSSGGQHSSSGTGCAVAKGTNSCSSSSPHPGQGADVCTRGGVPPHFAVRLVRLPSDRAAAGAGRADQINLAGSRWVPMGRADPATLRCTLRYQATHQPGSVSTGWCCICYATNCGSYNRHTRCDSNTYNLIRANSSSSNSTERRADTSGHRGGKALCWAARMQHNRMLQAMSALHKLTVPLHSASTTTDTAMAQPVQAAASAAAAATAAATVWLAPKGDAGCCCTSVGLPAPAVCSSGALLAGAVR